MAGEQAASASELGSSGFLRLIRCVISVGLAELLLIADDEAADAVDDDELDAAPLAPANADEDEEDAAPAASAAPLLLLLLMGLM